MPQGFPGSAPQATCHPEVKAHCKGLCKPCYSTAQVRKHRELHPEARKNSDALYRAENKEEINARNAAQRANNKELANARCRASTILTKYGITVEQYEAKLASQNNLCGLCNKPFYGDKRKGNYGAPVLDHDHKTGTLRNFLHRRCNVALGYFYDDPAICQLSVEYLKKYQEISNV
jgi:hypothetical protein